MQYNSGKILSYLFIIVMGSCQNLWTKEQVSSIDQMVIQTVHPDSITLVHGSGLAYVNGQPFSGKSITHYSSGSLASSISYAQGKREGWYRKWFEDGTLSFESRYVEGQRNGVSTSWWSNRNIRSISRHIKGIAHGMQEQWYMSGARFKRIQLINGKEEGLQQSWRENGKLYNNYEAIEGRIYGLKRANLCFQLDDEIVQYEN